MKAKFAQARYWNGTSRLKITGSGGTWLGSLHAALCLFVVNIRGAVAQVKVNFTLERAMEAQRGNRSIAVRIR
jgi:hypothetical protein